MLFPFRSLYMQNRNTSSASQGRTNESAERTNYNYLKGGEMMSHASTWLLSKQNAISSCIKLGKVYGVHLSLLLGVDPARWGLWMAGDQSKPSPGWTTWITNLG